MNQTTPVVVVAARILLHIFLKRPKTEVRRRLKRRVQSHQVDSTYPHLFLSYLRRSQWVIL